MGLGDGRRRAPLIDDRRRDDRTMRRRTNDQRMILAVALWLLVPANAFTFTIPANLFAPSWNQLDKALRQRGKLYKTESIPRKQPIHPNSRGGCVLHAGLAHNCDYKSLVKAFDEVDHWNSYMSPGKRKRSDRPPPEIRPTANGRMEGGDRRAYANMKWRNRRQRTSHQIRDHHFPFSDEQIPFALQANDLRQKSNAPLSPTPWLTPGPHLPQ